MKDEIAFVISMAWFSAGLYACSYFSSTTTLPLSQDMYALTATMFVMGCFGNVLMSSLVNTREKRLVTTTTALIMGMSAVVDAKFANDSGTIITGSNGAAVPLERYVLWSTTTSKMLYTMTSNAPTLDMVGMLVLNNVVILGGLVSQLNGSIITYLLSCLCLLLVLAKVYALNKSSATRRQIVYMITFMTWLAFPCIEGLMAFGLISKEAAEFCTIISNFCAKSLYSHIIASDHEYSVHEEEIRQLKKTLDRKREFLHMVTHEVRTPLNSIIHLTTSIAEGHHGRLSKKGLLYARTVIASGQRLIGLINDILDVSSVDFRGSIKLKKQAIDVRKLVIQVETAIRPLVHEGVLFKCTVDESVPRAILGDDGRMMQVLFNLLGNSCKFTSSGTMELSVYTVEDDLCIDVSDTGAGIPVDHMPSLYDSFTEAGQKGFGGTGLGLSITKNIVEEHGGTINMTSSRGVGTKCQVKLPLVIANLQSDDPHHPHTLLSVDDDPSNQLVVRDKIGRAHV
jgi:signal transduction histidine kinase